jgi:hypothetical protein
MGVNVIRLSWLRDGQEVAMVTTSVPSEDAAWDSFDEFAAFLRVRWNAHQGLKAKLAPGKEDR